jgi:cysteine desulfurase / selenocysteine lyase
MVDYHSAPMSGGMHSVRDDARAYETADVALAVRLGLCTALREHLTLGPALIHERIQTLATRLRTGLRAIPGITVRDVGTACAGLVTFTADGEQPGALRDRLLARNIVVSTPIAGYTPLDFATRGLPEVVRASAHVFNTEEEIDSLLRAVEG